MSIPFLSPTMARLGATLFALGLMASAGPAPAAGRDAAAKKPVPAATRTLIDVNSASKAQLKTLPGIGDAEADRIIAGRPYLSKANLVSAKAIPAGTYLSIKYKIIARQPTAKGS